jgi:YXWGXW repeat-containing protein
MMKLRSFILAGFLFVSLPLASSFAAVGVAINIAPPVLPVVAQPPCPVAGYIWTPGYWGWGGGGYYWVPGVWVAPPAVGLLWTPPWWGWNNGVYVFNEGYWGPTVGFYGGINYGYGYFGSGYWGGHWEGDSFRYNTAVTRVNTNVVHNTYVDQSVNRQVNTSRAAFNGPNGVKAEPTAEQRAAGENARKMPATSEQRARQEAAARDRNLQASVNKGQPKEDAIRSFNQREGAQHGNGAGTEGTRTAEGARQAENKPGGNVSEHHRKEAGNAKANSVRNIRHVSEHHRKEAGNAEERGKTRNVEGNKAKGRSGKTAKHEGSAGGHHEMTQKSRHPQMGAAGPKGGGNRGYAGGQQQGKKGQGKKEEGKKKQGRP